MNYETLYLGPLISTYNEYEGAVLNGKTRDLMQTLEANSSKYDSIEQQLRLYAIQALKYIVFHTNQKRLNPDADLPDFNTRQYYYRALFNLTPLHTVRHLLMSLFTIRVLAEWIPFDPNSVLAAALANMVHDESAKRLFMDEYKGIEVMSKLVNSVDTHVQVHTARGIFSITTIFDYKIEFANDANILEKLVSFLTLDNDSRTMNAAGSLANIAIHPKCKQLLVDAGALQRLQNLADHSESDFVAHQVARCLFSLAAQKNIRVTMCKDGILGSLDRMLSFGLQNNDILTSVIGCFGNLAMTEVAAQENFMFVGRIIAIFIQSRDPGLDRQALRVLFAFASKEGIKDRMCNVNFVNAMIRKIKSMVDKSGIFYANSTDFNMARDILGLMATVIYNRAPLKDLFFKENCDDAVMALWDKFPKIEVDDENGDTKIFEDVPCNAVRVLLSAATTDEDKPKLFLGGKESRLKRLCDACTRDHTLQLRKLALGALGVLSQAKHMHKSLIDAGTLDAATYGLFTEPHVESRKHAAKIIIGFTDNALEDYWADIAQYGGGEAGEMHRSNREFLAWAKEPNTRFFTEYKIPASICLDNCDVTLFIYEPLVEQRYPVCMELLKKYRAPEINSMLELEENNKDKDWKGVHRASWTLFAHLLHARGVQGREELLNGDPTILNETFELASRYNVFSASTKDNRTLDLPTEINKFQNSRILSWKLGVDAMANAALACNEPNNSLIEFVIKPKSVKFDFEKVYEKSVKTSDYVEKRIKKWISDTSAFGNETVTSVSDRRASKRAKTRDDRFVRVHKGMLEARSEYFSRLFKYSWGDVDANSIEFEEGDNIDLTEDAAAVFLEYVYYGWTTDMEFGIRDCPILLCRLITVGNYFRAHGLVRHCEFALFRNVTGGLKDPTKSIVKLIKSMSRHYLPCIWVLAYPYIQNSNDETIKEVCKRAGFVNA